MGKNLTLKQRKFVQAYVDNGGNATKAAEEVYGVENNTARAMGSQNLAKLNVREEIELLAGRVGLKAEMAVEALKDTLAEKPTTPPSHADRIKAADFTLRLLGYGQETESAPRNRVSVVINEPLMVKKFIALNGRRPTEAEAQKLMAGKLVDDISVED